jgi:protein TonB
MKQAPSVISLPLLMAFLASLGLHLPFALWHGPAKRSLPTASSPRLFLDAALKKPAPPPALSLPELELKTAEAPAASETANPAPSLDSSRAAPPLRPILQTPAKPLASTPSTVLPAAAMRSARQQFSSLENFYPVDAVINGIEGDVLVAIFLDKEGNVIAARIEQGSGHSILDEAALRAARALKRLPVNGQEEGVLSVRFRTE